MMDKNCDWPVFNCPTHTLYLGPHILVSTILLDKMLDPTKTYDKWC